MLCYKRKFGFVLFLCSNFLISNEDTNNNFISNVFEVTLAGIVGSAIKDQVDTETKLDLAKNSVAEIIELCIISNKHLIPYFKDDHSKHSPLIAKIISQTITVPFVFEGKKGDKDDDKAYELNFNHDSTYLASTTARTITREVILFYIINNTKKLADHFNLKWPPEIKKNKMLYQGGKFILNSLIRNWTDQQITKFYAKIN